MLKEGGGRFMEYLEISSSERQELVIQKLRQCCILFDFTDVTCDLSGKETKRQILLELIEYISTSDGCLPEPVYPEIINMVIII
jgi:serine/threonine-protein phosphatase 2A regulatory subunit B'